MSLIEQLLEERNQEPNSIENTVIGFEAEDYIFDGGFVTYIDIRFTRDFGKFKKDILYPFISCDFDNGYMWEVDDELEEIGDNDQYFLCKPVDYDDYLVGIGFVNKKNYPELQML